MRIFVGRFAHLFRQLLLLLSLFSSTGIGSAVAADPPAKPNVVFILADDLGWADIEPYGSTFHRTPNLKRLAERSVRFTNYYAASPLCSPTRSSILTGYYPARTGITAPVCHLPAVQLEKRLVPLGAQSRVRSADSLTRLKGEYVTTAEIFKQAGYQTAHFGKWHLGSGQGYEPKDQGFDSDIPHTPRAAGPGGGYFAPWRFVNDPQLKAPVGTHIDEWMADQAGEFIRKAREQPFFLNFWMYSVHGPWNADSKLIDEAKKRIDPKAAQRNPLYAAMVENMDRAVGKLLDALESAKVADKTIVIFTSDNGGFSYPPRATEPPGFADIPATSNAPLRSGKATLYEGGTRVPCLVHVPWFAKRGTVDAMFSSVDWFNTLTALCMIRLKSIPATDGVNQYSAIKEGESVRKETYVHFPHGSEAQEADKPGFWPGTWVRRGDMKLIRFYARNDDLTDRWELYDLKADIGETKNLADARPDMVRDMSKLITDFLKSTEAVVPAANPDYLKKDSRPKSTEPKQPTAKSKVPSGLTASKDAILTLHADMLQVSATGKDPFVVFPVKAVGVGPFDVEFELKSASQGPGQVFWRTADDGEFHRDRSAAFSPKHDDRWNPVVVRLPIERAVTAVRIDPSNAPGEMYLRNIRLKDKDGKVLQSWATADRK